MGAKPTTPESLEVVLRSLRLKQPATAAMIGRRLDQTSSWTNYRLGKLAAAGRVKRDEETLKWRTIDTVAPYDPDGRGNKEVMRLFLHAVNNRRTFGWNMAGEVAEYARNVGFIDRVENDLTDAGRVFLNQEEPPFDLGGKVNVAATETLRRAMEEAPEWLKPEWLIDEGHIFDAERYRKSHDCPNCKGRGTITITSGVQAPDKYPYEADCPKCIPLLTGWVWPPAGVRTGRLSGSVEGHRMQEPKEPLPPFDYETRPTFSIGAQLQRFGRALRPKPHERATIFEHAEELVPQTPTGGRVNYYLSAVDFPRRHETQGPYVAECEDLVASLRLTFDEACIFKAIWRSAAARLGEGKPGGSAVYDAEKMVHYAGHVLTTRKREAGNK